MKSVWLLQQPTMDLEPKPIRNITELVCVAPVLTGSPAQIQVCNGPDTISQRLVTISRRRWILFQFENRMAVSVIESVAVSDYDHEEDTVRIDNGRLKLVTSRRQCHWVVAQLYPTSTGGMVVFWPDKMYATPIGSFQLRDTVISQSSSHKLGFTLRSRDSECDEDLLTLICENEEDHRRWNNAFDVYRRSMSSARCSSSFRRLPSLEEEWQLFAISFLLFCKYFQCIYFCCFLVRQVLSIKKSFVKDVIYCWVSKILLRFRRFVYSSCTFNHSNS